MKTLLTLAALLALILSAPAQSILTSPPETHAERAGRELQEGMQRTKDVFLREFKHNMLIVWGDPDPQSIIDHIGPNGTGAAEAFWNSNVLAQFLTTILTAANDTQGLAELNALLSKVKPVTIHEDGTVTIDPEPSPTPSPTPEP